MAEERDYNEKNCELLMDAPAFRYIFIEEITKPKVTTDSTFEIILQITYDDEAVDNFMEDDGESGFGILGSKSFDCTDLCDSHSMERESYTFLTGTFKHTENGNIKLVELKNQIMS